MSQRRIWLAVFVFIVSFLFHLIGINQVGRTWDEQFKVDLGYIAWDRWAARDFSVGSWNMGTEHPMVAKYLYGALLPLHMTRLSRRDNPKIIRNDFSLSEKIKLSGNQYIQGQIDGVRVNGIWFNGVLYFVDYDWIWIRLLSDFFSSIALAGVFLITCWFMSDYWSLWAPAVLLFTPRFLAMGKQMTFESITAGFIVWTVIALERLLQNQKQIWLYLLVGLGCGLLVFTRYNNIYIFVLLLGGWFIHQFSAGKKNLTARLYNWRLILIPITALIFGYLIWPLIWHNFPKYLIASIQENQTRHIGPTLYYLESLFVTTPVVWLVGLLFGLIILIKKGTEKARFMIWWLFSAFFVFSIFGIPGGGLRYIFFVYPAIGIVTAVGIHFFLTRFKRGRYFLITIVLYGLWVTMMIHPYYLDYYNELIGGVSGAAKTGKEVSYWGEGQREVGLHLNEVGKRGASVVRLVTPLYVMPPLRADFIEKEFSVFDNEDYVVISRSNFFRYKKVLSEKYRLIYEAKAGGVPLVSLWEKK